MRRRIADEIYDDIHRALQQPDASKRAIALEHGVSRSVVDAIAAGRRRTPVDREANPPEPGDYVGKHRCETCGAAIVTRECLACKVLLQNAGQLPETEAR